MPTRRGRRGCHPARDDAQFNLGLAELHTVLGEPDVAGHGKLVAAAQAGPAVDGSDHRLWRLLDFAEQFLSCPEHLVGVIVVVNAVDLVDVSTGHKKLTCSSDDDHFDLVVGGGFLEGGSLRSVTVWVSKAFAGG